MALPGASFPVTQKTYVNIEQMSMGRVGANLHMADQFHVVNDEKLRLTLMGMADKYDERVRDIIKKTYDDQKLNSLYRAMRASGVFDHGGKSKVHRELVRFPNGYVYDFVDTVISSLYGKDWMTDVGALKHELVRPWHVVRKI